MSHHATLLTVEAPGFIRGEYVTINAYERSV